MKKCFILIVLFCAAFLDPYRDSVDAGNANYSDQKYQDAIDNFTTAEKYLPGAKDAPDLAYNKATALQKNKELDKAIEQYKKALASQNKDIQKKALFNMGNVYYEKGDIESAAASYINALKIDPNYTNAKKNLEYILNKNNKDKDKDKDNKDNKDNKDKNNQDKNNQKDKDKNEKNKEKKNEQNKEKDSGSKKQLNKEQIDSLMEQMKKKPVRRDKGDGRHGQYMLEKNW